MSWYFHLPQAEGYAFSEAKELLSWHSGSQRLGYGAVSWEYSPASSWEPNSRQVSGKIHKKPAGWYFWGWFSSSVISRLWIRDSAILLAFPSWLQDACCGPSRKSSHSFLQRCEMYKWGGLVVTKGVCMHMCVYVCVCGREREIKIEKERDGFFYEGEDIFARRSPFMSH